MSQNQRSGPHRPPWHLNWKRGPTQSATRALTASKHHSPSSWAYEAKAATRSTAPTRHQAAQPHSQPRTTGGASAPAPGQSSSLPATHQPIHSLLRCCLTRVTSRANRSCVAAPPPTRFLTRLADSLASIPKPPQSLSPPRPAKAPRHSAHRPASPHKKCVPADATWPARQSLLVAQLQYPRQSTTNSSASATTRCSAWQAPTAMPQPLP